MQGYLNQVKCLQLKFDSFDLLHVPRNGNAHADSLAMPATSSAQDLPRVILVEDVYNPQGQERRFKLIKSEWGRIGWIPSYDS